MRERVTLIARRDLPRGAGELLLDWGEGPVALRDAWAWPVRAVEAVPGLVELDVEVTIIPWGARPQGSTLDARAMEFTTPDDFQRLGAHVFRPRRARLAESLALVLGRDAKELRPLLASGVWRWNISQHRLIHAAADGLPWSKELRATMQRARSADEAWEALIARDVVPASWIDDPRRWFAQDAASAVMRSTPPGLRAVVAIGADPERRIVLACKLL